MTARSIDPHLRVVALKPGMVTGKEIAGDRVGHADPDRSGGQGGRSARHMESLIDRGHNVAGMMQEARSACRQGNSILTPVKEPQVDRGLELLNGRGDCGLRHVQLHRRMRDLTGLGGRDEVANLLQREGH
jgi:hypothetical protein